MSEPSLIDRFLANSALGQKYQAPTHHEKMWASIVAGVLFALISSMFMYSVTNNVFARVGFPTLSSKGPTVAGLVLHAVVFALIVRILMM